MGGKAKAEIRIRPGKEHVAIMPDGREVVLSRIIQNGEFWLRLETENGGEIKLRTRNPLTSEPPAA